MFTKEQQVILSIIINITNPGDYRNSLIALLSTDQVEYLSNTEIDDTEAEEIIYNLFKRTVEQSNVTTTNE